MEEKLLPCPFCGGEDIHVRIGTVRYSQIYHCGDCGCTLETNETSLRGSQWNNRGRR